MGKIWRSAVVGAPSKPCCARSNTAKTGQTGLFSLQAFLLCCSARLSASTALILEDREMAGTVLKSAVVLVPWKPSCAHGKTAKTGRMGFFFMYGRTLNADCMHA